MALIRNVTELWQFIALFGALGGVAELGGGFFISQALVPKWFVRKRGRALGISIMGVGLGALVFPTAISLLIEAVGWRGAWTVVRRRHRQHRFRARAAPPHDAGGGGAAAGRRREPRGWTARRRAAG